MEHRDALVLEDTLYVGLEEGVDSLFHLSDPRENLLMLARDVMEYIIGYRYFVGIVPSRSPSTCSAAIVTRSFPPESGYPSLPEGARDPRLSISAGGRSCGKGH